MALNPNGHTMALGLRTRPTPSRGYALSLAMTLTPSSGARCIPDDGQSSPDDSGCTASSGRHDGYAIASSGAGRAPLGGGPLYQGGEFRVGLRAQFAVQ
jgi:hypothetical protein